MYALYLPYITRGGFEMDYKNDVRIIKALTDENRLAIWCGFVNTDK